MSARSKRKAPVAHMRGIRSEMDALSLDVAASVAEIHALRRGGRMTGDYYAPPGADDRYLSWVVVMGGHVSRGTQERVRPLVNQAMDMILARPSHERGERGAA